MKPFGIFNSPLGEGIAYVSPPIGPAPQIGVGRDIP